MFDLKVGDNVKLNNDGVAFSKDQVEDNLKRLFNTTSIYEIDKITYDKKPAMIYVQIRVPVISI